MNWVSPCCTAPCCPFSPTRLRSGTNRERAAFAAALPAWLPTKTRVRGAGAEKDAQRAAHAPIHRHADPSGLMVSACPPHPGSTWQGTSRHPHGACARHLHRRPLAIATAGLPAQPHGVGARTHPSADAARTRPQGSGRRRWVWRQSPCPRALARSAPPLPRGELPHGTGRPHHTCREGEDLAYVPAPTHGTRTNRPPAPTRQPSAAPEALLAIRAASCQLPEYLPQPARTW